MGPEALAILGGALALAGGLMGSSIGIAIAASAGVSILSEDPKQLRNVLVLAAMPTTQTFYGLIIMLSALSGVTPEMEMIKALARLGAGIVGFVAELFSAIWQGKVCATGISMLIKTRGRIFVNAMMMAVYVELLGVLGLVFGLLMISFF